MVHPLGPVIVLTPGTPVNIAPANLNCQSVMVQALPTNTGFVYVLVYGTRVATLAVPTINSIPSYSATIPDAPGGLDARQFTIDAQVGGEGVDASYARP